nr:adp-ribosylation factor-like protein 2 [Quercus suber]
MTHLDQDLRHRPSPFAARVRSPFPLSNSSEVSHSGLKMPQKRGDVGGQKTLRTYWKNYFEKTDTLIWVVDATDRERLEDCKRELHGLLQQERLMGASLLVFKNKSDVHACMDESEIRQGLALDTILTHKWHIMLCSAMTGHNLQEGLEWVVQDAKDRLFLY